MSDETRERNRVLASGIATSVLSRGLAAIVPILVVPIALHQLGIQGYGVWATAVSITGLAVFADLGIGTGLMTRLGQANFNKETDLAAARVFVSTAYVMMAIITALGLTALLIATQFLDWSSLFGAKTSQNRGTIEAICVVTFAAFICNMMAGLIVRVQYAVAQQGQSNLWQTAGSVLGLFAIWTATKFDPGPGWFIAAAAFTPVLVGAVNTVRFFRFTSLGRSISPRRRLFRQQVLRSLLGLGIRFFAISVLLTASTQIDPWIVARTGTLSNVATFAIPLRLFTLIGTISLMLTLPLWPLHAKAVASGDLEWIRSTTRRMTIATTATVGIASLAALLLGPFAMRLWLHDQVKFQPLLWAGLAAWWFVQGVTGAAFMVQNGAEVLREQTFGYGLLLAAIPVKWLVSAKFGFEWIPFVGASMYVMMIWPVCLLGYRHALRRATKTRRV